MYMHMFVYFCFYLCGMSYIIYAEEHIGTRRTTIVSLLPSFLAVMLMDVVSIKV